MAAEEGGMNEEPEEATTETYGLLDSDAVLVSHYLSLITVEEARRYVALDLITALNPWTDKTIAQAKQIEAFLLGKGPRSVE